MTTDPPPCGARSNLSVYGVTTDDEQRAVRAVRFLHQRKQTLWDTWPPQGRLSYVVALLLQLNPGDPMSHARLHYALSVPALVNRATEIVCAVAEVDNWPRAARPVPVTLQHGMS